MTATPRSTQHATGEVPGKRSAALLAEQSVVESNARTYSRNLPIAVGEARGSWVTDVDGNVYLDFLSGAGVLGVGHNHPAVIAALEEQLRRVVHTLDLPTEAKMALAREVLSLLPAGIRGDYKVHFCGPTGADAVEAAIKLCKTATGRSDVIAFQGAYHGCTAGALSVTGAVAPKTRVASLMPDVHFFPFAYCHRCPLGLDPASCETNCATYLDRALADPQGGIRQPAAMLLEVVQGEGGSVPAPPAFVASVARTAAQHDVPLVVDEVQAGIGRTGRWFAFEHYDIRPDVIVLSKALGGAGLPIALLLYRKELDDWLPGAHIGTFRGNNLAFAAGVAGLRVMRSESVLANAQRQGAYLLERLAGELGDLPIVADVRGLGLMIGVELRSARPARSVTSVARRVQRLALEHGLIVELGGRDDAVIRLLPPLNLSHDEAQAGAEALITAVRVAAEEHVASAEPAAVGLGRAEPGRETARAAR